MLTGAHVIVYSKAAEADRAFLRDVLRLPSVDVGGGWLIFALPASEVAVHPADGEEKHELYLMCDDISAFIEAVKPHGIECSSVSQERWGLLTQLQLPGGGRLGVYEPRHPRPQPYSEGKVRRPAAKGGVRRARPKKRAKDSRRTSAAKKSRRRR
jgi:hypothetical protein